MLWLIILLLGFAGLHLVLLLPTQAAIIGAVLLVMVLWVLWKLKWVILGVVGLEELFGGRGDSA